MRARAALNATRGNLAEPDAALQAALETGLQDALQDAPPLSDHRRDHRPKNGERIRQNSPLIPN